VTDESVIEFPQPDYPIRVIADSHSDLRERVLEVVRRHDPVFEESSVELVKSREGTYCSVRMKILATGEAQLRALHEELKLNPLVKMVL
jgi:putative lipoic acid-binding regulatory protein